MPYRFKQQLQRLSNRLGLQRDWYLLFIAAAIGLVMGGVAMCFILPLHLLHESANHVDRSVLFWLVPAAPIVGALLTGLVHHFLSTGGRGTGISDVMLAIYRHKSQLPLRAAVRKWLGSTFTIGSGGSAGPEGPIVTIGSVIGSNIGRLMRTNPQNTATLLGCGAAAGIASVFNAPLAGVFFVLEILLRDFSLRTFTPIIVASVISAAFTQSILGNVTLFDQSTQFAIEAFSAVEIPNYLVLGVFCGLVGVMFVKALLYSTRQFNRLPVPPLLRPVCGAAMLGLLAAAYIWIWKPTAMQPEFYGNSYEFITSLLDPQTYYADAESKQLIPAMLTALVVLCILKGIATCFTIGSGGSGGIFAPSLMLGATAGGAFGFVINWIGLFPSASPAHYALVGMGAMVASTTHAPMTAILIVYEITRSYEVILPLMLAAVISTIVSRLVFPDTVYSAALREQGVRLGAMSDLTILRRLFVQDVPLMEAVTVNSADSAQQLLNLSERHSVGDFVVVNARGHYVGLVTGADLKSALIYREAIPLLQVNELQRSDLPTVTPEETLDIVLDKFSTHDVQSLAVLHDESGAILGLITRARLMAVYQNELQRD